MKHSISIFLVIFLVITVKSFSQGTDGVLIDPNNAITRDASAVFQAQSTSQGVLVPRMTAAQRVAIPVNAARDGLMVYQTDAPVGFYYYNGPTLTWVLIANTTSNLAGVTAGTGLTGGGTSGTITVNAVGDNGLTTNADDIDLGGPLTQAATTITQDGSETFTIANTGTGNTTINLTSTGDFDVQDNGTSALFVRDDAFVGVGTNAPNSPFTVRTTVATANARTTSLANAIGDVNFQLATVRGATTNAVGDITTQIGQVYGAGALTEGIQFIRGGGSTDGSMAFVTNAATERMRISSNGNVGIGSNGPTERLDVNGAIKMPSANTTDNNSPALTLVSDDDFLYDTEYINHYAFGFHPYNDGAGLGANSYISGYYGIDLFTGGAQRFRINNNGTVKINNLAGTGSRVVVADASGNLSATTSIGTGIVTGNGTQNYIPKWNNAAGTTLGNSLITDDATTITAAGQFDVTGGTGTSYTTAPIEIRTSAIAPRLAFHYSGVVASQIAVENSGTIAIRDNPGTGYENFIARDISANRNIYNQGILYHRTSAGQGSGAHGISWYDPSFVTWYDYMAPPGTTNAPSGTAAPQDATTGVTSWARRFNMENIGTYGWLFESGANTAGVAPTVKFAINASTGTFHTTGNGVIDGTLKIAGGSPGLGKVLVSDATGLASWVTMVGSGYGDNLGNHTATQALNMVGNAINNAEQINSTGDHLEFMRNRTDDASYEWMGFYSGATRQGIILYDGPWTGANNVSNEFSITAEGSNMLTLNSSANHIILTPRGGNVGIGTMAPASYLHVMGKTNIHQSGAGGGQNRFEGLEATTSANGRAQLVLSSAYSDLVIASSQGNDNHGSTLTFASYNPANAADYRKFVINQGNWGARFGYLDFGFADAGGRTIHIQILMQLIT